VKKTASFDNTTLPENAQNYNKYAYVLNNPLKYTDPSGNMSQHYIVQTNMYAEMSRIALQLSATRQEAWGNMKAQVGGGSLLGNMYLAIAIFSGSGGGGGGIMPATADAPDGGDGGDGGEIDFLIGISFDFTFATPYGGYAYEIGWIQSATGLPISRLFESTGNAFGAEISASFNVFILIPTTSSFEIEDIEGLGYSWDVTYIGSITIASDGTPSYPEDKIGNSFFAFKVGIGLGAGVVSTSKTDTHLLGTFFNYLGGFNYVYF
jgi:hypothetical protein